MLKIHQARLQQYVNQIFQICKLALKKGRETRNQIANIHWIIEKSRKFQRKNYFCFNDYAKTFDSVSHNKLWKILEDMRIPDNLTYLLRKLYAAQEVTVRIEHGTMTSLKLRMEYEKAVYCHTCLFNLYTECIM